MLKRFEVENFKGFDKRVVFDLTARDYSFNSILVSGGIVNKAIIYGKNGIGKSSLGIALFDIICHLTDKEKMNNRYFSNYVNLASATDFASFKYYFQFDEDSVIYEYDKKSPDYLLREKLTINNVIVVDYDYFNIKKQYIDSTLKGELNIDLIDNKLSVIKYIYRNRPNNPDSPLFKMMKFCENMLWFRCLSEGNAYCGFTNGGAFLVDKLYESGKVKEFQKFLESNGLEYTLGFEIFNGRPELMAYFGPSMKSAPFVSLASTGTMALFLFYIWGISSFDKISFLFIDEFDAFLHYESAENIVSRLNKNKNFQTILITHNTYLMQNRLTRPDCCFIMTKNKVTNLFDSTTKEIREAHNLEKMYINGAFNE